MVPTWNILNHITILFLILKDYLKLPKNYTFKTSISNYGDDKGIKLLQNKFFKDKTN